MVRVVGFEPTTSRFQAEDSGQTELHPDALSLLLSEFDFWYCQMELNHQPTPYEGGALPLSYGSMVGRERLGLSTFSL